MGTYVVTGCAGFIGSHLTDALLRAGHVVVGIDSFDSYYPRKLKEANLRSALAHDAFTLIEAGILDLADEGLVTRSHESLAGLLRDVDCVYHLAAQAGVRLSWGSSFETYTRNNVLATQRLLDAGLRAKLPKLVYASSSSIYGDQNQLPLHESMVPRPRSPYGVTKLAGEHLCGLYHETHGLDVVSLRFFSVYGPRQRPDMAFEIFMSALTKGDPVVVYGDGSQTRDFTYVDDVVVALMRAQNAPAGSVMNVGGGSCIGLMHAIETLGDVTGLQPRVSLRAAAPGDVRATWADTTNARRLLDYVPETTIAEGLARQWEWHRAR